MGALHPPVPAVLVVPAFSADQGMLAAAKEALTDAFGPVAKESAVLDFDDTAYYAKEMGGNLRLVLWAFARKVEPGTLPAIKHATNAIEAQLAGRFAGSLGVARPINLDPGLLSIDKFALATTKSRSHRLYLGDGIYGESTLRHYGDSYVPWPWTYPSYQKGEVVAFLNACREDLVKGQA